MQSALSPWEKAQIPTTNLSESIHASWLSGEGGAHKISLFDACVTDVVNAYMQCAKYLGYETGRFVGTGPDMDTLIQRVNSRRTPSTSVISGIIHRAVSGTPLFEEPILHGDKETVQRKRGGAASLSSHKPGYVIHSVQRKQRGRRHINFEQTEVNLQDDALPSPKQIIEQDISKSKWAIRRMPIHSKRKCMGCIDCKKCPLSIESRSPGEVAPCFWSFREYNGKQIPQWMWFCNTDVKHSWNVCNQVPIVPQLPSIWPIGMGTNLMDHEAAFLIEAGFDLGINVMDAEINTIDSNPPSSKRSKKWRHGISKEAEKRISKAKQLQANFLAETNVTEGQYIKFSITTGQQYEVHVKKEPWCSCADFQIRESKNKSFLACKHLYFVYLQILGLDEHQHMCIHQPILQERDLRLILNQERKITPLNV